jgi:hypothetical protein
MPAAVRDDEYDDDAYDSGDWEVEEKTGDRRCIE